jgi:hypothetical protein
MAINLTELGPLDRALCEFAWAHEDGKPCGRSGRAIALAWCRLDADAQARWLRYHPEGTMAGDMLRVALFKTATVDGVDLGAATAEFARMRGEPWP